MCRGENNRLSPPDAFLEEKKKTQMHDKTIVTIINLITQIPGPYKSTGFTM